MAARTEPPSERRLAEARAHGSVPRGRLLAPAAIWAALLLGLASQARTPFADLAALTRRALAGRGDPLHLAEVALQTLSTSAAWLSVAALGVVLGAERLQVGPTFAVRALLRTRAPRIVLPGPRRGLCLAVAALAAGLALVVAALALPEVARVGVDGPRALGARTHATLVTWAGRWGALLLVLGLLERVWDGALWRRALFTDRSERLREQRDAEGPEAGRVGLRRRHGEVLRGDG